MKLAFLLLLAFSVPASGSVLGEWDWFEKNVRDENLRPQEAAVWFKTVHGHLRQYCTNFVFNPDRGWVFPIEGYSMPCVGRGGFRKGYRMFDAKRSSGHSAYDLFILDRNRDCLDDSTGLPVQILAPVDLLVVSIYTNWRTGSRLRGGRYVWAFDPLKDRFFYFAHLKRIDVGPGDLLRAGDPVGIVGRTGQNAAPARSDSHLHLMVVDARNDRPAAVDYYSELPSSLTLLRQDDDRVRR